MCIFNSIEEDTDAYSDWLSNKKLRPYIILNKKRTLQPEETLTWLMNLKVPQANGKVV
ncbi:hypothetical protein [Alkalibacterium sp. m-11]